MSEASSLHLDPEARQILDFMERQPITAYTAEELAEQLDDPAMDIRAALAKLERLGYVAREQTEVGADEYMISPSARRI